MKFPKSYNNMCCEDVIKCVFDLNSLDVEVYKILQKMGKERADEIAKEMKKDRSTVYRSLQKLNCCGVCEKETKYLEKGGYYHIYSCNDISETKKNLNKCIDNWYKQMKETIKNLD